MSIAKRLSLLFLIFAGLKTFAKKLDYEVTCQLYDLATTHILAEGRYSPNETTESFIQFSFQEFQLKVHDQALNKEFRELNIEIRVENQPDFDVSETILYQPEQVQNFESLRLGYVWTEWPGVGNTLWLLCDAKPNTEF